VTDNYGVASVLLRWRRNGLNWRQTDLAPTGTVGEYQGTIPAPGMFGDTFEYRIEATDHAGYLDEDGNHTFGVVYPLLEATPASFDVLLLAGQATNRPLSLICSGNTGLVWHTETAPVGLGDDFESGAPGWTHGGANDQWHLSTNRAASPVHAWYCGDSGQYGDDMHATLDTPETLLGPEASLTFRHWIDTELHSTPGKTWDGAIVEISRNGGAYTQIAPAGGYPYTVHGHTASPWPDGTPCYAGTGAGWEEATFDLSAYAGDRVRVRFHFGSDGYTPGAEEGWYVDDVVIGPVTVTNTWLHVSPASGALAPGGSTNVTLVFDSAGIPSGTDDAVLLSLLSNDPVTPSRNVPARLRVRSRPKLELFFAAQTATDGTGLATLSNRVFDADTESCEMEILYSTDRGLSWTAAELLGAQASLGAVSVSNGTERQVTQIATDAGGVPATNVLAITWDTAAGPAPIALATGTLVRVRVWDGLFWGASATSTAFLVDNEPPSLPGSVGSATHAAGVWSTNDRVALHWSAASDGAGGGIGGYTYTFTNAPPAAGPLDGATAGFDALSGILADGTDWWAAVCAADVFGNTGPVTNLGPLWIDTVPPSPAAAVVTVARSALGDYVVGTTLSNSWTGFTDDLSGLAGYYYSLTDGSGSTAGAWTAGNAGVLHGAVGDQTNTVYVWAQDQAGGIGAAAAEPVLVLSADGDFDRDGSLSGHEEIAGTDATDSGSVFAIESISGPATNLVVLHWESVSNRFYSVYLAPSVTNASGWTPVPGCTNLPGTGGMMSYTDSVSGVQIRFYRLRVSR